MAASPSRNDYLGRADLRERRFFNHPNIQAALVEATASDRAPFSALVFRGTAGRLSNWPFNLDMAVCPRPAGGSVHRGFAHLILRIWDAITTELQRVEQPLYFTGHSLGGALATLAASLHAPHAVYTFGAPRIGDPAFAHTFSDVRLFNVMNPHDLVTQLPPAGLGNRFSQAGTIHHQKRRSLPFPSFFRSGTGIPCRPRATQLFGAATGGL